MLAKTMAVIQLIVSLATAPCGVVKAYDQVGDGSMVITKIEEGKFLCEYDMGGMTSGNVVVFEQKESAVTNVAGAAMVIMNCEEFND